MLLGTLLMSSFVQVNEHRLLTIEQIELLGQEFRASGKCEAWLADADPLVAQARAACPPSG